MTYRMLASGLIAGFAAGLFAALLHFAFIQPVLLVGELYESGKITHFTSSGSSASDNPLMGGHAEAVITDHTGTASPDQPQAAPADGHAGHAEAEGDTPTWKRNTLTVLFTGLTYAAYGLFLTAGFGLAGIWGYDVTPMRGLIWGLCGFLAFHLAPALGLPPELPGTIGADLRLRQAWWVSTVLATGGALAILASGRGGVLAWVVAGILLAAPHGIGAPQADRFWGVAPPELGALFATRALGVALLAWLALGWLAARLWMTAPDTENRTVRA